MITERWKLVQRALNALYITVESDVADHVIKLIDAAREEDAQRIAVLEAAIRSHRDARGDDRCWLDDEELYKTLPEGYTLPARDTTVELQRCEAFIKNRHNPNVVYVSPQRRIEELEAERAQLLSLDQLREHALDHDAEHGEYNESCYEAFNFYESVVEALTGRQPTYDDDTWFTALEQKRARKQSS